MSASPDGCKLVLTPTYKNFDIPNPRIARFYVLSNTHKPNTPVMPSAHGLIFCRRQKI